MMMCPRQQPNPHNSRGRSGAPFSVSVPSSSAPYALALGALDSWALTDGEHAQSMISKLTAARAKLRELEALRETLQRSRPRTRGKKAAKTRALNKLARRIPAAKGAVTKARKSIARAKVSNNRKSASAFERRSAAAKRGWETRRARKAAATTATERVFTTLKEMPFLTAGGVVMVWPPLAADRSKVGKFWCEVDRLLSNVPASFEEFEGDSIFDEISGKRLAFVTDLDLIYAYSDEFVFGLSIYRDRHATTGEA